MLFYLDNWQSAAPEGAPTAGRPAAPNAPQPAARPRQSGRPGRRTPPRWQTAPRPDAAAANRRPRGLNENYARELMELHTLGVDGGYTQKDVQEVARAFTGWTIANPRQGGGFQFEPRMHDDGEKIVLGHRIKAGGGRRTASRCSTSSRRIRPPRASSRPSWRAGSSPTIRRPRSSIARRRASATRDGDIREVVRTIVTSPEFFAPAAYRAKVKTPFEFVVSAVRATAADVGERAAAGAGAARPRACRSTVPAADRLRRPRRRLGQHRRAAEPHELRGRAHRRTDAAMRPRRVPHGSEPRRRCADATLLVDRRPRRRLSRARPRRRSRKATHGAAGDRAAPRLP